MIDFHDIRSPHDNRLLFRLQPETIRVEIVQRRHIPGAGSFHPVEYVDVLAHLPEPIRTRVAMALAGTVDLYAYYPTEIADKMHACNRTPGELHE